MKKLIALIMFFICLFGSVAISDSSAATPTDLEEFDDDDWGYIGIPLERKVYVIIEKEPQFLGDTVTFVAVLVDFKPEDNVTFQWQYAIKQEDPDWILIDNATEQTYTFVLDETNIYYWYRVVVKVGE